MAAVAHNLLDSAHEIRLKLECKLFDHANKVVYSIKEEVKETVSDKSADFELDINEIQKFQIVCMQPLVKKVLASIVEQSGMVFNKLQCERTINKKLETSWSDVVAGRNPFTLVFEPAAPQHIETVITSRSSQQCPGNHVYGAK